MSSVSVRAEIITEEEHDVLKIEIPTSRTVVSTSSGKMLRRRLKADGSPEVIPMYSYEVVTRLFELALLDFSADPLAGATVTKKIKKYSSWSKAKNVVAK